MNINKEKGTQEQLNSFLHHWVESPVAEDSLCIGCCSHVIYHLKLYVVTLKKSNFACRAKVYSAYKKLFRLAPRCCKHLSSY